MVEIMALLMFVGTEQKIQVFLDDRVDGNGNALPTTELYCNRHWPRIIYPCQKILGC